MQNAPSIAESRRSTHAARRPPPRMRLAERVALIRSLINSENVTARIAWELGDRDSVYAKFSDYARLALVEVTGEASWFSGMLHNHLVRLGQNVDAISRAREKRIIAVLRRNLDRLVRIPDGIEFLKQAQERESTRLKIELARVGDEGLKPVLRALLAAQERRCSRMRRILRAAEWVSTGVGPSARHLELAA